MRMDLCPCCGTNNFSKWYENIDVDKIISWKDFFYGSSRYIKDIYSCDKCGYKFIDELEEDFERHYISQDTEDNEGLDGFRLSYFRKIKSRFDMLFPGMNEGKKVLDIGCARGIWLDCWRGSNELFGSEYSTEHINTLEKKRITVLTDEDVSRNTFDVVSLFDVLEHISDPYKFLQKLKASLNSGGVLIVSVPDMGKLIAKLMKSNYYLVCPMHFSYFDKVSLSMIMERVFEGEIYIEKSPIMNVDLRGISRWINFIPNIPDILNFKAPIPYRASLIAYIKVK